jgi:TonB family protein
MVAGLNRSGPAGSKQMSFKNVGCLLIFMLAAVTVQTVARGVAPSSQAQDEVSGQISGERSAGIEMLTPTEGVDFNGYLRNVYGTTKKRWFANMPASVAKGNKGINSVEFRILQDGTVPKEFMKIKAPSGKADLDEASLAGIRAAAPFAKLPAEFTGPYIELRFTFYYNLAPPGR